MEYELPSTQENEEGIEPGRENENLS